MANFVRFGSAFALAASVLIHEYVGTAEAGGHSVLTGGEISATVSDATINGSMSATGPYTEFYAADGTIRGNGYTGAWTVEADMMCFKYGEDPKDCWTVGMLGDEILWIKDGDILGTGTPVAGNVNNF